MSQPTLSRLADAPLWRQPGRMWLSMIDLFCASFGAVPERIVLDIDDTDDDAHGGDDENYDKVDTSATTTATTTRS